MTNGIFFVNFSVGANNEGAGLVVISNGDINGGDHSYLYRGYIDIYGNHAKANVEISHYRGALNSVFGPLQSFSLELEGSANEQLFDVKGTITGIQSPIIRIIGRKVAQLYERGS